MTEQPVRNQIVHRWYTRPVLFLFAVAIASCGSGGRPGAFHASAVDSALSRAMTREAGAVVSLDSLGPKNWAFLYVFGPYTSEDAMRRCLATSQFESYGLDHRDDAYAFYFRAPNGYISSMSLPREAVEFAPDAVGREYPRGRASFIVRRASSGLHNELTPSGDVARRCS
jgi:hypothetical protein